VTLPPDDATRREQAAAQHVLNHPDLSNQIRNEYGQELPTIFDNATWTTHSDKGRTVQTIRVR
jgi:hypothetical protein